VDEEMFEKMILGVLWVRSHEEDTEIGRVYRPAMFPFPPSRGREAFQLKEDHSYMKADIGASDGTVETFGTWDIAQDDEFRIIFHAECGTVMVIQVVEVDINRLVVRTAQLMPRKRRGDS
jgi:hypothetical protein